MPKQTLNPALRTQVSDFTTKWALTPREGEILGLLAMGVTRIKEIAAKLVLSPNTINNHVNSIFAKTKTRSKSELLALLLMDMATEIQMLRAGDGVRPTSEAHPLMAVSVAKLDGPE